MDKEEVETPDSDQFIQSIIQCKSVFFINSDPDIDNIASKLVVFFVENQGSPIVMSEDHEIGVLVSNRATEMTIHLAEETKKMGEYDLSSFKELMFNIIDESFYSHCKHFLKSVSLTDIKLLQFDYGFYAERILITDEDWVEFVLTIQEKSINGDLSVPDGVTKFLAKQSVIEMDTRFTADPNLN